MVVNCKIVSSVLESVNYAFTISTHTLSFPRECTLPALLVISECFYCLLPLPHKQPLKLPFLHFLLTDTTSHLHISHPYSIVSQLLTGSSSHSSHNLPGKVLRGLVSTSWVTRKRGCNRGHSPKESCSQLLRDNPGTTVFLVGILSVANKRSGSQLSIS